MSAATRAQAGRPRAVAAPALAGGRLDQRVREAEEAEREQDRAIAAAAQGRPAWKPPATISTSLTKSGEGGRPASVPSEMPSDAAERGLGARDAGDGVRRRRAARAEERRRGVEAERLRDARGRRCGPRRRRARAACRSRCRARSRPCARGSSRRAAASRRSGRQRNGTATASETSPKPSSTSCAVRTPDDGRERVLGAPGDEQHGRQERGGEQGRDRRRRLGVRVGEPVVHGRPADLGGEPGEQQQVGDERVCRPPRSTVGERAARRARRARRPGAPAASDDDPEQRDAEPERGEDQVLPARLERPRPCR